MVDHRKEYEAGRLDTTDGKPPVHFDSPAPNPAIGANGQHASYWVLSESERAKGFIRPVRNAYKHVGIAGPSHPLRDLTDDEQARYGRFGYAKFEAYPEEGETSVTGKFWTQPELDNIGKGCGTVTTMGRALAETYAAKPGFYGSTMCVGCRTHLPVGRAGEFTWVVDGVDTGERVGT